METTKGNCSICDKHTDVRYIDIYAFGSEGVWACEKCSAMIARVVANISYAIKARISWAKYKGGATEKVK